ncbi:MAG: hypothetical protein H7175_26650, partial [Burkholderiales bacterium]|nr:hypothetical protein [Anaerolineae bacterium]
RVQASHWVEEFVPGDFSMQIDGAPPETPLINIGVPNRIYGPANDVAAQSSYYENGQVYSEAFTAPADGIVTTIRAPHLGDPVDDPGPESIRLSVYMPGETAPLAQTTFTGDFTRTDNVVGDSYNIAFDSPLTLQAGQQYNFMIEILEGGPVISSGAIFSHEGGWDDPVPTKVCRYPAGITLASDAPPGLTTAQNCNGIDFWYDQLNGYELSMAYEDVEDKRQIFMTALDNSDYLTISSNRFYDSEARIPVRWPMSLRYYEALFSGELGFELAQTFNESFELGPLRASDQYLPTYQALGAPNWLNEFEAEEAFTVYDHPTVFIFHKTDAYTPENTARILNSVPLNRADIVLGSFNDPALVGVVPIYSLPADAAPTYLMLNEEERAIQYDNGTWSNRFDSSSIINTQPAVTITVWWLTIVLFGWVVWPLLFAILPGLADRGYGFAKYAGMTLTAWLAWLVSSVQIPMWSQMGVLASLLVVGTISAWAAWRNREAFVTYLRDHWKRLVIIEIVTLAAFLTFLIVRLSNPDLWHPSFGGEKPMDFAYFNAVLRSTIFPPLDPWYAGGYLNYYYFGFNIVGAPVLLLGLLPSIAYNLIIPTLFALTGIAAFSVAFNVVAGWRVRVRSRVVASYEDEEDAEREPVIQRLGNPYLAGIAALLLAVVFGNLDTVRVFGTGLAQSGGYSTPTGLQD